MSRKGKQLLVVVVLVGICAGVVLGVGIPRIRSHRIYIQQREEKYAWSTSHIFAAFRFETAEILPERLVHEVKELLERIEPHTYRVRRKVPPGYCTMGGFFYEVKEIREAAIYECVLHYDPRARAVAGADRPNPSDFHQWTLESFRWLHGSDI